jgi:hypothetical protein
VFWAVGVRLFIAGVRQVAQPQFTAESIFEIKDRAAFAIVRELGFANLSTGLGLANLAVPAWVVPAAIVGGLFYGLAAAGHAFRGKRNFKEQTALISADIFAFVILAVFCREQGL